MKRKDMVEKLARTLRIYHDNFYDNKEEGCDILAADGILNFLENRGMLPPRSGIFRQVDIRNKWDVKTGEVKMLRVIESEWEPEDGV